MTDEDRLMAERLARSLLGVRTPSRWTRMRSHCKPGVEVFRMSIGRDRFVAVKRSGGTVSVLVGA